MLDHCRVFLSCYMREEVKTQMAPQRCSCGETLEKLREAKPRLLKQLEEEARQRLQYIQRRVDRAGEPSLRNEWLRQRFFS